ncbi:MAG: UDP-N-acetylmuramate dehydrogenase [Homoserinimonas sp.]|nr:UDP-N-acetylmuramate dehydrogenase [Homoserinimonas sp.]MCW5944318.1 UDP-N-acetylmuramate dehydrogenase [Cryobacterium sp.]
MKLAELTTLRVGGEARELVSGSTADELIQLARSTWAEGQPWLALGGGSNLVISDGGFDGTVIRVLNRGIEQLGGGALRVQAGENWDDVVAFAIEHGLAGIEALSGIPGSAGAGPVQNIGAYGQEIAECLDSIDFLDEITGERQRLRAEELELGYRTSTLKQGRRGILLSIDLKLEQGGSSAPVRYAQLASALGVEIGERVALASVREAVLRLRASKGMLLDPSDPDSVSVGSFFTNPIVSENFARSLPAEAPRWLIDPDAPESDVKLSAAWLIEKAGIRRGFSLPGSAAAISSKHTLAIVNTGGATAEQIVELARYIHLRVLNDFGVLLQPEPILVGLSL